MKNELLEQREQKFNIKKLFSVVFNIKWFSL